MRAVGLLLVTDIFTRFVKKTVEAVREPSRGARFQTDGIVLDFVFFSPYEILRPATVIMVQFLPSFKCDNDSPNPSQCHQLFSNLTLALLKALLLSCPNTSASRVNNGKVLPYAIEDIACTASDLRRLNFNDSAAQMAGSVSRPVEVW